MSSTLTLKFHHASSDQTRLLALPREPVPTFHDLATLLQQRFDLISLPIKLVYQDDEGDDIVLSSDVEVAELIAAAEAGVDVRTFELVLADAEGSEADSEDQSKNEQLLQHLEAALKKDPSLVGAVHHLLHKTIGKRGGPQGRHHCAHPPHKHHGRRGRGRWHLSSSDGDSSSDSDCDSDDDKHHKKPKHPKHRRHPHFPPPPHGPPPPGPPPTFFGMPGFFGFGMPPPPFPFGGPPGGPGPHRRGPPPPPFPPFCGHRGHGKHGKGPGGPPPPPPGPPPHAFGCGGETSFPFGGPPEHGSGGFPPAGHFGRHGVYGGLHHSGRRGGGGQRGAERDEEQSDEWVFHL